MISLHISFVRSKIVFYPIIWYPVHEVHSNKFERSQGRFVKYLWYKEDGTYPEVGFRHDVLLSRYSLCNLEKRSMLLVYFYIKRLLMP
ncbi:unnamed protein product [Acanthoscelides obtectus]|uniref:Uncharacterized protein n=1 Tax=Acanthoscelides obtectus TaxID=200917 RepID=A0A9P0PQJ4_ACAOB|nr:unnamed protein product [Acanthoscelides obtectus]CAK1630897.1 hypothetical protein AOBTE_LOCUS6624 [Acanthoscelides obtectus]